MAVAFNAGLSNRLRNAAAPLVSTGYPVTVAAWVYPTTTAAARSVWSLTDPAAAASYFNVLQSSGDQWSLIASDGTASTVSGGSVTANAWTFLAARFITTTNRRLDGLLPDGSTFAIQSTASRAPTNLSMLAIGAREVSTPAIFFTGRIGEFWYAAANIAGTGALDSGLLRSLAYGGPFARPSLAAKVIEYRAFRKNRVTGEGGDVYVGAGQQMQSWTNVNGVTIGPHPPLPYWYANPRQRKTLLPF